MCQIAIYFLQLNCILEKENWGEYQRGYEFIVAI